LAQARLQTVGLAVEALAAPATTATIFLAWIMGNPLHYFAARACELRTAVERITAGEQDSEKKSATTVR